MSHEERNTVLNLITSLLVNAWFLSRIWTMFHDGTSTAPDGLQIWAQTMLWVVPVSIGATIALTVLVTVLTSIVTGDRSMRSLIDERDHKFQFYGMGATMASAVAGFLIAMVLLALGYGGFVAFTVIYLSFFIGDIAGSLVKLGLYRCGI
jgi:hypothetical protein